MMYVEHVDLKSNQLIVLRPQDSTISSFQRG